MIHGAQLTLLVDETKESSKEGQKSKVRGEDMVKLGVSVKTPKTNK